MLIRFFQSFRFRLDSLNPMEDAVLASVPKEADIGKLVKFYLYLIFQDHLQIDLAFAIVHYKMSL